MRCVPPNVKNPSASAFLMPARWSLRTARRRGRASDWSGRMQSHSCTESGFGAAVAVVDILKV